MMERAGFRLPEACTERSAGVGGAPSTHTGTTTSYEIGGVTYSYRSLTVSWRRVIVEICPKARGGLRPGRAEGRRFGGGGRVTRGDGG